MLVPFDLSSDEYGFVDKDRYVSRYYSEILEKCDDCLNQDIVASLEKLITIDPDFLDPYLDLSYIADCKGDYARSDELITNAYKRAVNLLTQNTLGWPEKLLWSITRNRHIIRALFAKAEMLWKGHKHREALALLRYLLKSNPYDNIGARYFILGILMKYSYTKYVQNFEDIDNSDEKQEKWFNNNINRFPKDFVRWDDWRKENIGD